MIKESAPQSTYFVVWAWDDDAGSEFGFDAQATYPMPVNGSLIADLGDGFYLIEWRSEDDIPASEQHPQLPPGWDWRRVINQSDS